MNTKRWFHSKTLWANAIVIALMVAEYLLAQKIYSPEIHAIALAILNMILRKLTTTGITK